MADAYEYVESTGVIVPDTAEIQTEVEDEWKSTFGDALSVDASTPQGIIITSDTLVRSKVVRNNAALANQINPNQAGGIFLDAICALTGLERDGATRSIIQDVSLTGVPSTNIPAGVTAKTSSGDIFESTSAVTLDVSGNATVDFRSVDYVPIPAPAASLTQIVVGVLGWETVTNTNAATLGQIEQSDQSLRALRRITLALQGTSINEAIISAVNNVDGVSSMTYRENYEDTTEVIDGVTLLPHSIWACVNGGTDEDVAQALFTNKSAGCGWNNGDGMPVTVDVTDPLSGQIYPVKFDRPDNVSFLVRATVRAGSYTGNVPDAVRASIVAYSNNDIEGETGIVVGQALSPFELAGAVNEQTPGIFVKKMEISYLSPVSYVTTEIDVALWEIASISESSITVVVE